MDAFKSGNSTRVELPRRSIADLRVQRDAQKSAASSSRFHPLAGGGIPAPIEYDPNLITTDNLKAEKAGAPVSY